MAKMCTLCSTAATDPDAYAAITATYHASGASAAGREAGLSQYAVRSHYTGINGRTQPCAPNPTTSYRAATTPRPVGTTPSMDLHPDGTGTITTGDIEGDTPVAWDDLIRILGGNPTTTQVKNDTIRVSARTNRDGILVRSYSAALEPRNTEHDTITEQIHAAVDEIRTALRTPRPTVTPSRATDANTFMIAWGDTQIGKAAGGGITGVIERFFDAIDNAIATYRNHTILGRRFNNVFMPIMGDITEGVAGNYDSQLFTVCLNDTDQQLLGIELITWAIERVRTEIGLPLTVAFVNSNHGERSRLSMTGGAKNKTSASDTNDRLIGEVLRMRYETPDGGPKVTFIVPGGNLVVPVAMNGVPIALAHGHGIGPRQKATTIQQELLIYDSELTAHNGGTPFMPKVWITAHYHHYQVMDVGPYTWIQTPALDGGSSWFTNTSGKYSRPGLVTALIGAHHPGGINYIEPVWVANTPQRKKPSAKERLLIAENRARMNAYSE